MEQSTNFSPLPPGRSTSRTEKSAQSRKTSRIRSRVSGPSSLGSFLGCGGTASSRFFRSHIALPPPYHPAMDRFHSAHTLPFLYHANSSYYLCLARCFCLFLHIYCPKYFCTCKFRMMSIKLNHKFQVGTFYGCMPSFFLFVPLFINFIPQFLFFKLTRTAQCGFKKEAPA